MTVTELRMTELAGPAERRLRSLELSVHRRLDGLLRGEHLGLVPGSGTELAGSREYRPGEDDARRLDWAVTARTAEPHVRQTVADRELGVHVVVDGSASMDFGTAAMEKRDLAAGAVAAVGFLTAAAGNRLSADIVRPGEVRRIPARSGRAHLLAVLRAVLATPRTPPGAASPSLGAVVTGAGRALRRRGLVVIVSDFLEPAPERELRRLSVRHQVLAVEVLDPRELFLPDVGTVLLTDPETGRQREVATHDRKLRERYAAAAAEHRAEVAAGLRRSGVAHLQLRTDRDWVTDVVRHVHARRRTGRRTA